MRFFSQQLLLIILLSIGTTSLVHANMTYVEQDYGDDYRQGLAYINHKAKEFIAEYNQKHNTNWHTLEPNAKVFVPTCTVALKARWSKIALTLTRTSMLFLYIVINLFSIRIKNGMSMFLFVMKRETQS
jgi:hypothetical protein